MLLKRGLKCMYSGIALMALAVVPAQAQVVTDSEQAGMAIQGAFTDGTIILDPSVQQTPGRSVQVIAIVTSGSLSGFSLKAYVRPETAYLGVPIRAYIAAQLADGRWFFKTSAGWVPRSSTPPTAGNFVKPNGSTLEYTIASGENLSAYVGAKIHVGYGYTYDDMIQQGLYSQMYTLE